MHIPKIIHFTVLMVLWGLWQPIAYANRFPQEEWAYSTPEAQGINSEKLQAALDYFAEQCGKQGVSEVVVVRNGSIIWAGPNVTSLHPVWSCSKSFGSMVAGLLYDDGLIDLETPLATYVPEYKEHYPDVKIHHALSLTDGFSEQDWQNSNTINPPLFKPGEYFHYGPGVNPLARALTAASQREMDELFLERIGNPIGITSLQWGNLGEINGLKINGIRGKPTTSIKITSLDMARVGLLLLNKGNWNGEQLLSEEWIDLATQPVAGIGTPVWDKEDWYKSLQGAYGYLFWVNGTLPSGDLLWPHAPPATFALQGNKNNICLVVPEWDMVIVRLGTDKIVNREAYDGFFERLAKSIN